MRAVTLTLVLLLGACGFQLRNDFALPFAMQSTYVDYRGVNAQLQRTVARALALSDVSLADSETAATAILQLASASVGQRVLAKDIEGRPREYEISVSLAYSVVTPDGVVIVPPQEIQRRNNIALDPSDPLAAAGNIARAREGLLEDAVWDMLRRIAATDVTVLETVPEAVE